MVASSATFSADRRHRLSLTRVWDDGPRYFWLGFNPSTADELANDHSIRKEMGFTLRAGGGSLIKVNLFALRGRHPVTVADIVNPRGFGMTQAGYEDAIGPDNDRVIVKAAHEADVDIAAWGDIVERWSWAQQRVEEVLALLSGIQLLCLGKSKNGSPLHPLMQPWKGSRRYRGLTVAQVSDQRFVPWGEP